MKEKCEHGEHREGFTCEQSDEVTRMIRSAAIASELFGDDELEEFCEAQKRAAR